MLFTDAFVKLFGINKYEKKFSCFSDFCIHCAPCVFVVVWRPASGLHAQPAAAGPGGHALQPAPARQGCRRPGGVEAVLCQRRRPQGGALCQQPTPSGGHQVSLWGLTRPPDLLIDSERFIFFIKHLFLISVLLISLA